MTLAISPVASIAPVVPLTPMTRPRTVPPAIANSAAYRLGYHFRLASADPIPVPPSFGTIERADFTLGILDGLSEKLRREDAGWFRRLEEVRRARMAEDREEAAQRGEVGAWA